MKYLVTITPKFPFRGNEETTREIEANSKREANKLVRRTMEIEGHIFTQSEQATFRAEPITQ